ncbi:hypothetical protein BRAS3843_990014 [Bradyrhizobium sp. STM 3843]|nr:hypothetical protein BRAS3843_990014 [Bradyrhizobium sp. STM 3843]
MFRDRGFVQDGPAAHSKFTASVAASLHSDSSSPLGRFREWPSRRDQSTRHNLCVTEMPRCRRKKAPGFPGAL